MRPLITGSLAYDYLARVGGRFADGGKAFVAPELSRVFGGCAGNIAYALRRLGNAPLLCAAAGGDFADYEAHLRGCDVDTSHILRLPGKNTSQAFVATDDDGEQFTTFHPGASDEAHRVELPAADLAIVSPTGKSGMLRYCEILEQRGAPFIFDPGQMAGHFSGEEFLLCLSRCDYAIFNADEFNIFQKTTGLALEDAAAKLKGLLITRGAEGSQIFAEGKTFSVAAVHLGEGNPTGCGDAYRGGIMHGLLRGWEWQKTIAFASAVAGVKAAAATPQGYELSEKMALDLAREHCG